MNKLTMPDVIRTMELLNYSPNKQGACFGIAAMASQAALRKDVITFANRIYSIRNASVEDIETLGKPIKYIETLENKKEIFSKRLELLSFFDELSIYQGSDGVNSEFKQIVPMFQDISIFRKKIAPEKSDDYIYPEIKWNVISLFSYNAIYHFITDLKKHLNNEPFSIMISRFPELHATQIGFDGTNWISTDHDEIILGPDTKEGFSIILQSIFKLKDYGDLSGMLASLDIVLPEKSEANLTNFKGYDIPLDDITPSQEMLFHLFACCELSSRYDLMADILDKIKFLNLTKNVQIDLVKLVKDERLNILARLAGKGKHGVLRKILEVMTALGLDIETKISVFNKKARNDLSPLFLAAQEGHKEVVQLLLEQIQSIDNDELRADILSAKRKDGVSALFMAATNEHEGVIDLLLKAISDIKDEAVKADLIAAKGQGNTPPILLQCAVKGYERIVALLLEATRSIKDDKLRGELLSGKMSNGSTALYIAVQHKQKAIVNSMLQTVLETTLPEDILFNLLAGKNSKGITSLLMAVQNNDIDMVKIITEYIIKSDLSLAKKEELITAAFPPHIVSAYYHAISKKNSDISEYLENTVLNHSEFTMDVKNKILQRKSPHL